MDNAEEIARLRAQVTELEDIAKTWQGIATNDPELVRVHWAKGQPFTAEVRCQPLLLVAAACRDVLEIGRADNYVALQLGDDIGELEVLVRRKEGKTPAVLATELKALLATARGALRPFALSVGDDGVVRGRPRDDDFRTAAEVLAKLEGI